MRRRGGLRRAVRWMAILVLAVAPSAPAAAGGGNECADAGGFDELRRPFFGDTHIHTRLSLDASTQGTIVSPDEAYRFARGERLSIQPLDAEGRPTRHFRLARPLDFAAVSDHAEFFGEVTICEDPGHPGYGSPECILYRERPDEAFILMNFLLATRPTSVPVVEPKRVRRFPFCGPGGDACVEASTVPWAEIRAAAAGAYEPCRFTTFVAYEWSGSPETKNLHRNVVFRNESVPEIPVGYFDAPEPELLWDSLTESCLEAGLSPACDVLTIPHNSNLSSGLMFRTKDGEGRPFTSSYAARRQSFEPLVEIFQHKGDSECLPGPGQPDELCGFEKFPYNNLIADRFDGLLTGPPEERDFVRDALKVGLAEEQRIGVNPFKYGIVGSTDTHIGAPGAAVESDRFPGHGGAGTSNRDEVAGLTESIAFNPGGLAVVWAEENTRESIFAAMRRREAYGTSGPRIRLRFFGGWDLPAGLCDEPGREFVRIGYGRGVPMGADLPAPSGGAPVFALWAMRDPGAAGADPDPYLAGDLGALPEAGTPLQRIQVVKGWIGPDGARREKVFDVAGSGQGAGVDPATCATTGPGSDQLCGVWTDPEFDPAAPAFYYARAVENPTCRWSTLQCNARGVVCGENVPEGFEDCCDESWPKTIQERAWSSPIWYRPAGGE